MDVARSGPWNSGYQPNLLPGDNQRLWRRIPIRACFDAWLTVCHIPQEDERACAISDVGAAAPTSVLFFPRCLSSIFDAFVEKEEPYG